MRRLRARCGQFRVVSNNHAAFAGSDDLIGVKAETPHRADAARSPAVVFGAVRFGGVLDDGQTEFSRQFQQWIYLRHMPVNMHRHDRASLIGDFPLDLGHIEAPSIWLAIHQDRNASGAQNRRDAGDDGKARQDDLRAGRQRQRRHRQFERNGSIANRHAVGDSTILRPTALKLGDEAAFGGNPTRAHSLLNIGESALVQQGLGNRNHDVFFVALLHFLAARRSVAAMPAKRVLSASPT